MDPLPDKFDYEENSVQWHFTFPCDYTGKLNYPFKEY